MSLNLLPLSELLSNYETAIDDGNYNVQVSVYHENVGVMVGYPDQNGGYGRQFFYPGQRGASFPNPIPLKRGNRLAYWVMLLKQVVNNGSNRLVNFGVGAQETGPGTANEVVQVSCTQVPATPSTRLTTGFGEMAPLYYKGVDLWKFDLQDLPVAQAGMGWSIEITHNQSSTVQQLASIVFLVDNSSRQFVKYFEAGNRASIHLSEAEVRSGRYYLCALVKGTRIVGGDFSFQVGDPEKDAKARMVRV